MLNLNTVQVAQYNTNLAACRGLGRWAHEDGYNAADLFQECLQAGLSTVASNYAVLGWESAEYSEA